MMTKEGSIKIVNWVLMLGGGHYSKYALSSPLSIYSILIAIVLRDSNAVFLCHC